jgi:hypothetical protein
LLAKKSYCRKATFSCGFLQLFFFPYFGKCHGPAEYKSHFSSGLGCGFFGTTFFSNRGFSLSVYIPLGIFDSKKKIIQ